jgi:hypothetical protein
LLITNKQLEQLTDHTEVSEKAEEGKELQNRIRHEMEGKLEKIQNKIVSVFVVVVNSMFSNIDERTQKAGI